MVPSAAASSTTGSPGGCSSTRSVSDVSRGEQVCDAHPELIRAAKNVGTQTKTRCPICEESDLKLITYVFGSRLPAHGRCVSTAKEMRRLGSRTDELTAYVVEACVECRWHHLLRVLPVGGNS